MPHPYGLTADESPLAATAADIASRVCAPSAATVDANAQFPAATLAALREAGVLGLTVPTTHGGLGHGPRTFCAVVEELAQACASSAMVFVMHVTGTQAIAASSTLGDRDAILRAIAAGAHLSTLGLSETGSRSQFWAPVSQLVASGDGFVTSARKSWITSAHHFDSCVASAQQPQAASPLESTLYLLRRGVSGMTISQGFDGLGLRGNDSTPVTLEDVRLAPGDLLTALGAGPTLVLDVILPWFAIGTAAMANGLCRAAVAATASHLRGTGFTHTSSQLRDLPNLRARLAEMSVRTEQSRTLLGHTLAEMHAPSDATPLWVLQARLAAIEAAVAVTDLAMKACGGAAFSKHLPVERLFRDARAGWVMAPTADHLQDFIGKALTGLPLF